MSYNEIAKIIQAKTKDLKKLAKENPVEAQREAEKDLIEAGLLAHDGTPLESICR